MKNVEIVLDYIQNKITEDYILTCVKNKTVYGVTASEIEENLNIVRNNASTILNDLWKTSKLIKINTRPVAFIPIDVVEKLYSSAGKTLEDTYTVEQLNNLITRIKSQDTSSDPFQHLIGSNDSLFNQIGQAKAAIIYPPKGLHTLILGESGVGKTTFAYTMHEYGKLKKNLADDDFPFISFNCSDYFNNPQLLLSQLFGHCKGAFTGADSEKVGLVEKADGGILFLDEIHRLPPNGQEMLFYLMDKGEFHRMGETEKKRKCNILIIAATTEQPSGTLLATFLRRIPVVINMPSFREKSIGEKIEIIQNDFAYESKNLNKKIRVSPQVLKALALYPFSVGNIGEVRSEIKLLCAKSFLSHLENEKELIVEFKMLASKIKENALNCSYDDKTKAYLKMFSEDLVISPLDDTEHYNDESKKDIYELIIKTLEDLKGKCLSKEVIESQIRNLIENNFKDLMDSFDSNNLNLSQLYKIVPKDITDFSSELITYSQNQLSYKLNNKFIFPLALHIQSLLKRIQEGKPISNPDMCKIRNDYPEEFNIAKELIKLLSDKFGIIIPEDEKGFLAILLAKNKQDKKNEEKVKLFIICHGYSTATSMANVANTLLNSDIVKSIDMPLDADITTTYNKLKASALSVSKGSEILLLVDMGSLIDFGEKLMNETGIKVRTIENVSTLLVLEALRNIMYKNDDVEELYNSLINKNFNVIKQNEIRKKAILTFCATGQGASMIAKNILNEILDNDYKEKINILTTNYTDSEETIIDFINKYDVIAVIGSFKPNVNVPYFPINKLLNPRFQKEFIKFLDTNINENNINATPNKSVFETSKDMLEQYVKFINPKFAIVYIKKFIESLKIDSFNENGDETIDLVVHLGCMLDRCIHGDFVKFEGVTTFKEKNLSQFNEIRQAIRILEKEYTLNINDDEICYIIKIINR